jgi:hypothetical protein
MTKGHEESQRGAMSRRTFTRGAALAAAVAAVLPAELVAQTSSSSTSSPAAAPSEQSPKLSAGSQAEAEARIQNILRKYGSRLSDAEKADLRKLVLSQQESMDKLRDFPLENWDEPALTLHAAVVTR